MTVSKWQGTLVSIKRVSEPFDSIEVKYTNSKSEEKMQRFGISYLKDKEELTDRLNQLSTAENTVFIELDMIKNTKGFWTPVDIRTVDKLTEKKEYAGTAFSSGYKKTPYKDNTVGQIKGNVVSNAVSLAVGRGEMDSNGLKRAAKDVLELHRQLEAMDIGSIVGLEGSTSKKEDKEDVFAARASSKEVMESINKQIAKKSNLI